ncbi:MAG: flagellar biosynthesis protein FlhB [Lachnospiraceae bacterium]|nr:flagellar biosynthesis protein FlhB [Lachnospiraceae bacterium]
MEFTKQAEVLRISYDLQFFAQEGPGGEKTEEPTTKKLNDARKEGQVAKSKEIANAFGLMGLFLVLKLWSGMVGNQMGELFGNVYSRIPDTIIMSGSEVPWNAILSVVTVCFLRVIIIVAPIFAVGFMIAFISDVVQVGWHPTAKPMQPKLSKISPLSGFKRLFSVTSLMELFKSIAKILLIGIVAYRYIMDQGDELMILLDMPLTQAIGLIGNLVINLGLRIAIVYLLIALADLIFQRVKFNNDMKMTKQEVKDEMKDTEGNPEIKGKQRQRMQEASRRRMMQQLPQADVVITNPTHFAVAIKYDAEVSAAPVVIAKGADYLALKIKEVAKENKIEIVENKPLARMLYANVDIGAQIPPELYQAVAEVLAYVYHLQGKV